MLLLLLLLLLLPRWLSLSLRWIQVNADPKTKTNGWLLACGCERAPCRRVRLVYIRLKATGRR